MRYLPGIMVMGYLLASFPVMAAFSETPGNIPAAALSAGFAYFYTRAASGSPRFAVLWVLLATVILPVAVVSAIGLASADLGDVGSAFVESMTAGNLGGLLAPLAASFVGVGLAKSSNKPLKSGDGP
jgi:hypothetical protein